MQRATHRARGRAGGHGSRGVAELVRSERLVDEADGERVLALVLGEAALTAAGGRPQPGLELELRQRLAEVRLDVRVSLVEGTAVVVEEAAR